MTISQQEARDHAIFGIARGRRDRASSLRTVAAVAVAGCAIAVAVACSSDPGGAPSPLLGVSGGTGSSTGGAGFGGNGGRAGSSGSAVGGSAGTGGADGSVGRGGSGGSGGAGGTSSGGSGASGGSGGSGTLGSGGVGGGSSGGGGGSGVGGSGGSASGGACGIGTLYSSKATYYTLATPLVNCSYPTNTLPAMYTALNEFDYLSAAACGACMRVTGPKGSIEVMVVDECPYQGNEQWCYPGSHHVDLNQAAFGAIGDLSAGVIDVTWQYVPCKVTGPLSFTFKDGSSIYWSAVMVRNHSLPLTKVEVKGASGSYQTLARQDYNYFIASNGFGNGPYSIRVTDSIGGVVEQTNLQSLSASPLSGDKTITGTVQLPGCN